ncbi:uncharacterized protein LOC113290904 [Papaver somniferum]|uniref:uncharacterized protein LOC113290904 n=1 Tax=Papaver somniferum TaxID=3469 RepID=UPI000E6FAFFA|nr:uncharacterized protein LOC113290904 [Papaver somniferum]
MAAQINCTVPKYMMEYLKKQSPGRTLLTGTSSKESNNRSSMTTIQRDQATHFTYEQGQRMSFAMLCQKKLDLEIEVPINLLIYWKLRNIDVGLLQARDTVITLAQITRFANDWCCMYCPECNKESEETRNGGHCPECLKYNYSIPILRLTMMVNDGPESTIFRAKGDVAEELLGRKADYLMHLKEEYVVQHVFKVLYEVLHCQIVFQVQIGI